MPEQPQSLTREEIIERIAAFKDHHNVLIQAKAQHSEVEFVGDSLVVLCPQRLTRSQLGLKPDFSGIPVKVVYAKFLSSLNLDNSDKTFRRMVNDGKETLIPYGERKEVIRSFIDKNSDSLSYLTSMST
jgi:hypothetical protein